MNPLDYARQILSNSTSRQKEPLTLKGCVGPARALFSAALSAISREGTIILLYDNESAERFAREYEWYLKKMGSCSSVVFFPGLDCSPYSGVSPHPEICKQRVLAMKQMLDDEHCSVVTTVDVLAEKIISPETFIDHIVDITLSKKIRMELLRENLFLSGYKLEDPVTEVGEFAIRGGVLDVFPPNLEEPLRIEFFGSYIDSIRTFNPSTQRSVKELEKADILPMHIYLSTRETFEKLCSTLKPPASKDSIEKEQLFEVYSSPFELFPQGWEFRLPEISPFTGHIFDYAGERKQVISIAGSIEEILINLRDYLQSQQEFVEKHDNLASTPEVFWFGHQKIADKIHGRKIVQFEDIMNIQGGDIVNINTSITNSFMGNFKQLFSYLRHAREDVVFVLSTKGRCERVASLCTDAGIEPIMANDFSFDLLKESSHRRVIITKGPIIRGFRLGDFRFALLGNEDVFPHIPEKRKKKTTSPKRSKATYSWSFKEIGEGDYVVHIQHGIGLFKGLEKIDVMGVVAEVAHLEYAEGGHLYVPVERMDLIQKYSAIGEAPPALDKLGGATWKKTKAKIKKSMRKMAEELLAIYARRATAKGFSFPPDDEWQREFEEMFEFEETIDQLKAIRDVKRDMESERLMDRLICGDVGYGKTEVAMRAAFKSINAGKQVAVLAPTTVLAFQHYNTFVQRFASFPVRIELLSRFRSRSEQKKTLERLLEGSVDIVIGTHRLLSKDVLFHDLGLLIVDEEQRFGVSHKEKIKKLKSNIDVLTLSATPIPRTLYMSVVGIRDISVIETPPRDRLSIQTILVPRSDEIIKEAIQRELQRNGQVYFIHNRIETIHEIGSRVRSLVPEARVAIAHGKMKESELEKIILDFVSYKYDVLISTTIIENGIDIPLVNTIIINNAHKFGLAQLYQLRGRVGRSSRRAYAWLLVDSISSLSDIAKKRLAAIRDFSELGSGFRLAALDLEIRGAGNILGHQQHGHIQTVGFETYCRLMEEAIKELKGEHYIGSEQIDLKLHIRLRIPSDYISSEAHRLQLYKRIASATDEEELDRIREEVKDRYGTFPEVMEYLFQYISLRILAQQMRIPSIERKGNSFVVQLTPDSAIEPEMLVEKVQREKTMLFSPQGLLTVQIRYSSIKEMFSLLKKLLLEIKSRDKISAFEG